MSFYEGGCSVYSILCVCVCDPDSVYDMVTHCRVTDCSACVCVCVCAHARNQVVPSTTHANILFNMFLPRLL